MLTAAALATAFAITFPNLAAIAASPSHSIRGLVTADGKAARGATILIEAMPQLSDGATAAADVQIKMYPVATVRSNSHGRFSLTPSGLPPEVINEFGAVNLLATVSNGKKMIRWAFPLSVGKSRQGPSSTRTTADLQFELGASPAAGDLADLPSSWAGSTKGRVTSKGLLKVSAEAVAERGIKPELAVCYFYWTSNWKYAVDEAYANIWSWTGAKVTAHEDITTSHNLGIAVKNTSGNWSQSGTVDFGFSGGSSINSAGLWDNQVNNEVNYRQQKNTCSGAAEWWYPVSTASLNYPILGWAHSLHPRWTACATYGAGNQPKKTQGTNVTYSAGVGFGPISLSAKAGWSTEISQTFVVTSTSKLCGSTAEGWVSSPQAEAHQP